MIVTRSFAIVALAASVAGGAFAQCGSDRADFAPPQQFSALRQDHAIVDDAIAAMPSSDLYGTINRLSAVFNRSQIDALKVSDGECGNVPANAVANIRATVADLASDLDASNLANLSDEQVIVLFQLVRTYAFRPILSLHDGNTFCYQGFSCVPHPEGGSNPPICTFTFCPIGDDPAVYDDLDGVLSVINPVYQAIRASLSPTDAAQLPASLDGNNYIGTIGTLLTIKGVESIDD